MTIIIADILSQINKKFIDPTPVGDVTTPKSNKLHSADISYLEVVKWFQFRGYNKKCYLTKADWPVWLVRFGGKAIHYQKQKERWKKMRDAGFVIHKRCAGNRNKEYDHYITQTGLDALSDYKNGTSKSKKRYLLLIL